MDDSLKAKLKALRDKLAAEVPRLRSRVPPELVKRLDASLRQVGDLYLIAVGRNAPPATFGDAVEDALAEAHLLLHEVERAAAEPGGGARPKPRGGIERRQHERLETQVTVRLLRHSTKPNDTGGASLGTDVVSRAARNVSVGGIFVTLPPAELPQVGVGSVVHLEVGSPGGAPPFNVRAVVMRRDAIGLGLRWMDDVERARRDIQALLEAVRRGGQSTFA